MNSDFTCRDCGAFFKVAPAVLARYPGWTPPLCNNCRAVAPKQSNARGRPQHLDHAAEGPQTGVFTDGCCEGNPGPGGWGAVKVIDGNILAEVAGADPQTTNNRMELTALIEGFKLLSPGEETVVYSDSALCVNIVNSWAATWKRNGWTRGAKHEPVANLELVKDLFELSQSQPKARVEWIKAHVGYTWNEYADRLARSYQSRAVTKT